MPRTITASVCVAALPPMPATTGMNIASATTSTMVSENNPTTDAAKNAVPRFTSSHGRRRRKRLARRGEDAVVDRHAGQAEDVLGRLVLDDVDDVVDRDDADELVLGVDNGNGEEVVGRDLARDLFLIGVDARAVDLAGHDALERRVRRHEQQPAQGHDADQVAPLVDDVEIEDHLDVARLCSAVIASPAVRSSARANTFGFIKRPAVFSSYSSRSLTPPPALG